MEKQKLQRARVLGGFELNGVQYNSNDVIESDPKIIKSLGSSVDPAKDAVYYCLKQKNPVIKKHEYIEPGQEPEKDSDAGKDADAGTGDNPQK